MIADAFGRSGRPPGGGTKCRAVGGCMAESASTMSSDHSTLGIGFMRGTSPPWRRSSAVHRRTDQLLRADLLPAGTRRVADVCFLPREVDAVARFTCVGFFAAFRGCFEGSDG